MNYFICRPDFSDFRSGIDEMHKWRDLKEEGKGNFIKEEYSFSLKF